MESNDKTNGAPVAPVAVTGAQSETTNKPIDATRFARGIEVLVGCLYSIRRVHRTDGDVDALVTHVENTLDVIEDDSDVDAVVSAVMGPDWRATLTAEYDGWDDDEAEDKADVAADAAAHAAARALFMERVRAAPAFRLVYEARKFGRCSLCDENPKNLFVILDGVRYCQVCGGDFDANEEPWDSDYDEDREFNEPVVPPAEAEA